MKDKRAKIEDVSLDTDEKPTKDKKKEYGAETKDAKGHRPFIDTSHTRGVIKKIKSDLTKAMSIFDVVSMVVFGLYYPYLIYQNHQSTPHLVAYIILFVCAISSFAVEMIFKKKEYQSKREEKLAEEKRAKINILTKCFQYSAKFVTVIMALLSTIKDPGSNLSVVTAILSGAMLGAQVLFEIVSSCVKRYAEYLEMAFEMDMENSFALELFQNRKLKALRLEKDWYESQDIEYYTEKQKIIRERIIEGSEKVKEDSKNRRLEEKETTQKRKQEISQNTKEKRERFKEEERKQKIGDKAKKKEEKERNKAFKELTRKGEKEKKRMEACGDIIDLPDTVEG